MTLIDNSAPGLIDTIIRDYLTGTRTKRRAVANDIEDFVQNAQDDIRSGEYVSVTFYAERITSAIMDNTHMTDMRRKFAMGLAIALINAPVF